MNKTKLCELAEKYKTDKCIKYRHNYTPYYYNILSPYQETFQSVLEIGIGFPGTPGSGIMEHVATIGYEKGASLKMWREFFPNATIFGIDNHSEAIFQDNRITTFLTSQTDKSTIQTLCKNLEFDFILDDGGHILEDQQASLDILFPFLKKNGIYIIEDLQECWTKDVLTQFENHCINDLNCKQVKLYDIRKDTNYLVNDDMFILIQK